MGRKVPGPSQLKPLWSGIGKDHVDLVLGAEGPAGTFLPHLATLAVAPPGSLEPYSPLLSIHHKPHQGTNANAPVTFDSTPEMSAILG